MKTLKFINKKFIGLGIAGLMALSVIGATGFIGTNLALAHDPVTEHSHPHEVEVDAPPVVMSPSEAFDDFKAYADANGFDFRGGCDSMSGSVTAMSSSEAFTKSGYKFHAEPWDVDSRDAKKDLEVSASVESEVCAAVISKHEVKIEGF